LVLLLKRPEGRPLHEVRRFHANFSDRGNGREMPINDDPEAVWEKKVT
jgi:hypothetical protein